MRLYRKKIFPESKLSTLEVKNLSRGKISGLFIPHGTRAATTDFLLMHLFANKKGL